MKALSIRQPWAWLIVHGWKDVENRNWQTKHRGRFLVHAAQGMTRAEYSEAVQFVAGFGPTDLLVDFAPFDELQRGGIIGSRFLAPPSLFGARKFSKKTARRQQPTVGRSGGRRNTNLLR
jgi:hypothetical protein